MSSEPLEAEVARVKEFRLELEMMIATMLSGVSIPAIERVFGSDSMSQIVAKTLAPIRRHVRR